LSPVRIRSFSKTTVRNFQPGASFRRLPRSLRLSYVWVGVLDQTGGFHAERVAVRVIQQVNPRALVDPQMRIALAGDVLVGWAYARA
jgi:hypothetical protein